MAHLEEITPGVWVDPFAVKGATHPINGGLTGADLHLVGGQSVHVSLTPAAAAKWVNARRDAGHHLLHQHNPPATPVFPHASLANA